MTKRSDKSKKQERKQAEASILRNMKKIQKGLDDHRAEENKKQVMQVLTRFLSLKKVSDKDKKH